MQTMSMNQNYMLTTKIFFLVHNTDFIKTHFQHYKIMETMKRKVTKPL